MSCEEIVVTDEEDYDIIVEKQEIKVTEVELSSSSSDTECQIDDYIVRNINNNNITNRKSAQQRDFFPHSFSRISLGNRRRTERRRNKLKIRRLNGIKSEENDSNNDNNVNNDNDFEIKNENNVKSETIKTETNCLTQTLSQPIDLTLSSAQTLAIIDSNETISSIPSSAETNVLINSSAETLVLRHESIQPMTMSSSQTISSTQTSTETFDYFSNQFINSSQNNLTDISLIDLRITESTNIQNEENMSTCSQNITVYNDIYYENCNEMEVTNEWLAENDLNDNYTEVSQMSCNTQALNLNLGNSNSQTIHEEVKIQKSDACIQTSPVKDQPSVTPFVTPLKTSVITPIKLKEISPKNFELNNLNQMNVNDIEMSDSETDENELFICSFEDCKEKFMSALLHYKHEKKHLRESRTKGIKLFNCQMCPYSAYTLIDLIFHNAKHTGLYFCKFSNCSFSCDSSDKLNIHVKKHDKGKCSDCHKYSKCNCGEKCCKTKRH